MPNDFFRWEDAGALVHHCPHCQQPLTNPRSRGKCLGHHVEWCRRYHTQLFKKGGSSSCMACRNSDEQSEQRHRSIAQLIHSLSALEGEQGVETPKTPLPQRKESVSISTPGSKKDRKAAKKAAKAAGRPKIVTAKEVEQVREVIHPPVDDAEEFEKALIEDENINANLYYHSGTANTREMRHNFIKLERSGKGELIVEKAELDRILSELNVPALAEARGKQMKSLVSTIAKAVEDDLIHIHNEDKLVMQRKAGFWRWASRKAYDRLCENNRIWDWKSEDTSISGASDVVEPAAEAMAQAPVKMAEEETVEEPDDGGGDKGKPANADLSRHNSTSTSGDSHHPSMVSDYTTDRTSSDSGSGADNGWTAVGKTKSKSQPKSPGFNLKLSLNGGINHLLSKPSPKTPRYSSYATMLGESDYDEESDYACDEVSPLTARFGRSVSFD